MTPGTSLYKSLLDNISTAVLLLDHELSEMRAKMVLSYFLKEIGPFAYNKGVKDAESFFRGKVEDLTATCFEDGLTYWVKKRT